MDNRLIFLYHVRRAMEGRRRIGRPGVGCPGASAQDVEQVNPLCINPRRNAVTVRSEAVESMLPRKSPKYSRMCPYRKPTQVGGVNNPRRSRELWLRNSAK